MYTDKKGCVCVWSGGEREERSRSNKEEIVCYASFYYNKSENPTILQAWLLLLQPSSLSSFSPFCATVGFPNNSVFFVRCIVLLSYYNKLDVEFSKILITRAVLQSC